MHKPHDWGEKKQTEKAISDVNSYQRLVENLRKRLSEKDALIDSMKEDYQQRINNYKTEIAELQKTERIKGYLRQ